MDPNKDRVLCVKDPKCVIEIDCQPFFVLLDSGARYNIIVEDDFQKCKSFKGKIIYKPDVK